MKKVFRILLWIIVALIFAGTFVFLYLNSKSPEITYQKVKPSFGDIENTTVLTGTIEPRDEVLVKPQISGIINEIFVEAGDHVNEGDIIAKIKVIPDASQLSSAQSRVNLAQIEFDDASVKFERDKELYAKKVISREEYETSEKTFNKTKEELASALDTYKIVREGVSMLNASESNTLIRATVTGLVLDVPVKVGSSVIQANTMNDGTTIATIADMNKLIFTGKVDETEVGSLRVGLPMEISIGAMPSLKPTATIEYISPKGNNSTGANSFEIKAALVIDNAEGLRAGYSANAKVTLERVENVLTIPEAVVEFEGNDTYVYVLADSIKNEYTRTAVTTGLSDGVSIEVKEGIDSTATVRGNVIL